MKPFWVPKVTHRLEHMVELTIPVDPQVSKYRLLAHRVLDTCRTAPIELFQVTKGEHFVSPSLLKYRGSRWADTNTAGQTVIRFDPDDFYEPTDPAKLGLPHDGETMYLVVDEFDVAANAWVNRSPILVIHDPTLSMMQGPFLALYGTAPNIGVITPGEPPGAGFLHFHVPGTARGLILRNLSANTLYAALSPAQAVIPIPANSSLETTLGMTDQWLLASSNNATTFYCLLSLINIATN